MQQRLSVSVNITVAFTNLHATQVMALKARNPAWRALQGDRISVNAVFHPTPRAFI